MLDEHISNKTLSSLLDWALHQDRGLKSAIQTCLNGFEDRYPNSERNKAQQDASRDLSDEAVSVGILNGPAGCGKTKIALEWAKNTEAKKIYWVCPRIQVCEGIFADLCSDEYLPETMIEIVTGEIKKRQIGGEIVETPEGEEFTSTIVITTIDQIINTITIHKQITAFTDFMHAHVVFDEYHEYINMSGFNLLFAELIEAKRMRQIDDETMPDTLLVSATPNPLFITEFLHLNSRDIIGIKSFNERDYKITFLEMDDSDKANNPLMQKQTEKDTFVISNTAISAQRSFIEHQDHENAVLFHSKFTKSDKEKLFEAVYHSFKKDGTHQYDILRSGPVVQASLNITSKKMVSEMTHAENFLQRLGRLDRFGENNETNHYFVAISDGVKNGKSKDSSSRFLNRLDSLQSAKAWYVFLQNNLTKETYRINDLYALYEKFYEDETAQELILQDMVSALKKSVENIRQNILDPVLLPNKKKDATTIKLKKNSLRGNSVFVQMAKLQINSNSENILNEYAYDDMENALTVDLDLVTGYGDSDKNLLAFMVKKHHNIKGGTKSYRDTQRINDARDPATPIYLSYTPSDLNKVNSKPHPYAVYYAVCKKQPIGIIGFHQLKGEEK